MPTQHIGESLHNIRRHLTTGKHKSAKVVAEALDLEYTHPSNLRRKVVLLTDYLGRG